MENKWNISKAVAYLTKNAHIKSIGKCAKYVRTAIEAGGLSTNGHPISAYQYIDMFSKIDTDILQSMPTDF